MNNNTNQHMITCVRVDKQTGETVAFNLYQCTWEKAVDVSKKMFQRGYQVGVTPPAVEVAS